MESKSASLPKVDLDTLYFHWESVAVLGDMEKSIEVVPEE